jgi:hypothetical protein
LDWHQLTFRDDADVARNSSGGASEEKNLTRGILGQRFKKKIIACIGNAKKDAPACIPYWGIIWGRSLSSPANRNSPGSLFTIL